MTYRQVYRTFVARTLQESPEEKSADVTSTSLIAENLCIAARDPACRADIIEKMLNEIGSATNGRFSMGMMDLARELEEGRAASQI